MVEQNLEAVGEKAPVQGPIIDDSDTLQVGSGDLSMREFEIADRAARGHTYKEIAKDLTVSVGTVRTHLHNTYGKLGISGKGELPFVLGPYEGCLDGLNFDGLSKHEREVFDLLANGLTIKEIGLKTDRAPSTVRTHEHNMGIALGLKKHVELTNVALAFKEKNIDTAISVQSEVVSKLVKIGRAEKQGHIQLGEQAVREIHNPKLASELFEKGYISEAQAERGELNLPGLVAGLLINQSETKDLMADPHTQDTACEVIHQEVRLFLNSRSL